MSNAAVDLNCNVTIKVIDRHGHVSQEVTKHNKATVSLVDGILRFLQGDFITTEYNKEKGGVTPEEAPAYLPVRAGFGRIGVKLVGEGDPTANIDPKERFFSHIDKSEIIEPTFTTNGLQEQVVPNKLLTFSRIRQTSFTDPNNSECLKFIIYIDPGTLVGYTPDESDARSDTLREGKSEFVPYDWSYYNPATGEYEAMLTEAGLFSDSNVLLARVLFDGEVETVDVYDESGNTRLGQKPEFVKPNDLSNPIIQSESSTVVLEWRIGITSVGDNDTLVTQNDITTTEFIDDVANYFVQHRDDIGRALSSSASADVVRDGGSYEVDDTTYQFEGLRTRLLTLLSDVLDGTNLSDLQEETNQASEEE